MWVSIQPGNHAKLTAWNFALVFEAPVNYCEPEDSPESWLPWPEILSHNQTLKVREVSHSGEAIRFFPFTPWSNGCSCLRFSTDLRLVPHLTLSTYSTHGRTSWNLILSTMSWTATCGNEECVSGTWYSLVGACPLESLYKKTETWIRIPF